MKPENQSVNLLKYICVRILTGEGERKTRNYNVVGPSHTSEPYEIDYIKRYNILFLVNVATHTNLSHC